MALDGLAQCFDGFIILGALIVSGAQIEIRIANVRRFRVLFDVFLQSPGDLFNYLRGQGL